MKKRLFLTFIALTIFSFSAQPQPNTVENIGEGCILVNTTWLLCSFEDLFEVAHIYKEICGEAEFKPNFELGYCIEVVAERE